MSIRIRNKENKTYIVLGSPHSATSFIAKSLQSAGVEMGAKGENFMFSFCQDYQFVATNKRILTAAGGDLYYNIPSEEKIMSVDKSGFIKRLIARKKGKLWGWKDPVTSLTIKHYLPHLDGDPYLVCVFRKPQKIVNSYKDQEGGRITKKLIDRYNNGIISAIKEFCEL